MMRRAAMRTTPYTTAELDDMITETRLRGHLARKQAIGDILLALAGNRSLLWVIALAAGREPGGVHEEALRMWFARRQPRTVHRT